MAQLLRFISLLCCTFVLVSFLLFAIAQTSSASKGQANAIANGQVSGQDANNQPVAREKQPRRFIDQVAQKLNSPWNGVISTTDKWVKHLIPTAISLLVYGFLLGFIARWATGRPA
jgi:hypothetical protein